MATLEEVCLDAFHQDKVFFIKTIEGWPEATRPALAYRDGSYSALPEGVVNRSDWVMGRGEYRDIVWMNPTPAVPAPPKQEISLWSCLLEVEPSDPIG